MGLDIHAGGVNMPRIPSQLVSAVIKLAADRFDLSISNRAATKLLSESAWVFREICFYLSSGSLQPYDPYLLKPLLVLASNNKARPPYPRPASRPRFHAWTDEDFDEREDRRRVKIPPPNRFFDPDDEPGSSASCLGPWEKIAFRQWEESRFDNPPP